MWKYVYDKMGPRQSRREEKKDLFGLLIRHEFGNFVGFMIVRVFYDLYLDMNRLVDAFSRFPTCDILFVVSREELISETAAITNYIRPMKKVWRSQNDLIDQVFSYVIGGTTFDGKSDFTSEMS